MRGRSYLKLYKPGCSSQFPVRQRRDLRVGHCASKLPPAKMSTWLVILSQLLCLLLIPGSIEARVAQLAVDSPLLPDGFIPFPDIGAAYKYFDSLRTWNSARKTCLEYKSNLAVIDSWTKIDHVQSIRTNDEHNVVTGIHRLFGDGEWLSVKTALPVAVLPWAPERYDSNANGCLAVKKDGSGLFAGLITTLRHFVCEIPLPTDYNQSTLQRCNELNSTAIIVN